MGARTFQESQALTRAAPTLATEGISLYQAQGIRVTVRASGANTLSGAGSLLAYLYDPVAAQWIRNPSLDLPISVATGTAAQAFPDMAVTVSDSSNGVAFRVLFAASGITVSAGTTVDVFTHVFGSGIPSL